MLNQLCLGSLFSKPQHPARGGEEEILLHRLLLALQQIPLLICPLLCLDLFCSKAFNQILNQPLCMSLYCTVLHFIYHCTSLWRKHISLEPAILAAVLCPMLISDASCMNLGNRGCTLEAGSLVFPNLRGRTISHWLWSSLHSL